jgi:hypothetical protein
MRAALRLVNFFTGFRSSQGVTPAKLFGNALRLIFVELRRPFAGEVNLPEGGSGEHRSRERQGIAESGSSIHVVVPPAG